MNKPREHTASGKLLATMASVVGLALVWSVVWANLPSWEELLSAQPRVPAAPAVPELDLTIPGVPSRPLYAPNRLDGAGKETTGAAVSKPTSGFPVPQPVRAGQVAEVKCAAEVQEACPDALTQEERPQCLERRLSRLSTPCQTMTQKRMAR